ncbi:MAG: glycine zipper 2TM domain-containing protein [Betaproteobacteria bacterium]|nr:glycine zipper 2TM domain-containing protein [Betaproteobacteria bacterium]
MKKILVSTLAITMVASLASCAMPGLGGGNYSRAQVRGEQSVRLGIVESVRDVVIDARDSGVGTAAGAAIGGVAGSTLGRGDKASAAGAIAGAVVGGIIGSAVEKNNNDRKGVEVTIRLEGGNLIAITQEKDEEFRVGDKVRVLSSGRTSRVSHL